MKIKSLIFFTIIIVCCNSIQAQQIFTLSQFTQHNFIFNPAAAGASDHPSVGVTYRKMWTSIPGGPQTSIVYGDTYFAKQKTGVAVVVYDDKTGPTSRSGGQINVSYSIKMEKEKRLMFGLGGQFLQYKINKADFATYIPNDPLLASAGTSFKADMSAGIYYKSPTLNAGISVQQLIQSKLNFIKSSSNPEGKLYRHYYFMGSYNIKIDDVNVVIPNVMVQYQPNAPADYSAGIRLEHDDFIWVGLNHHFSQGFSAFAGLKIKGTFSVGYAYDRYSTPLNLFADGSGAHEISLRYFFIKRK